MAREINLVPDIKNEMLKTLKLRNFIFFLCIIVGISSAALTAIVGLIMGGQQLAISGKENTIKLLSEKVNSYSDLSDFLTIRSQLSDISTLTSNKKVLSRTFNILSALLPKGADTITISELNVNLESDAPTLNFDAQANAGQDPFIDYNVLESFKKSMQYMRYDYGRYVDKQGNEIPAYCIIESDQESTVFTDADRGIYAFWTIDGEGCNPSADTEQPSDADYSYEDYGGQRVVRIWRTPQYAEWYHPGTDTGTSPQMTLSGQISNVPHFESSCTTYTGDDSRSTLSPEWTVTNDSCFLVPGGIDGIKVTDSSNGRGADEQLVLRFSATISLNPEVYRFTNYHMLAVPPAGRYNVTDSYVQVKSIFGERAKDCAEGDSACSSTENATPTEDSASSDEATTDENKGGQQ